MGTNAKMSNFISADSREGSRFGSNTPWCYIVHRLSPVSREYVVAYIDKIQKFVAQHSLDKKYDYIRTMQKLLKVAPDILKNERPLFVQDFLNFMHSHLEYLSKPDSPRPSSSFLECLEDCFGDVFTNFTQRKRIFATFDDATCKTFSFANLQLTSPEYWKDNIHEKELERNAGIHGHIAYLYVPPILHIRETVANPDQNPKQSGNDAIERRLNFFGICLQAVGGNIFEIINELSGKKYQKLEFKREQVFRPFIHEPIGELAFTIPKVMINSIS